YAVLGISFNSLLPLMGIEKFVYLTPIGAILWVLATFYSIHYYKLLDIEVLFCDAIRYGVFIAVGLVLNYILHKIFNEFLSFSGLVSSTLSLLVVGTIYFITPVRERINNTIRNIVLRRRTTYQKLLETTADAVIEILDLDSLFQYVLKQIHNSLGATKICIFLLDEETKDENGQPTYRLSASYGIENLKTTFFKQYKIINWLKQYKEPLLLDIAYHMFDPTDYKELTESLHLFGAIIIIPIIYKSELIGIITIDQKKVDGTLFDLEDIEILKTLAEQLAVAIKNSKMYQELNTAYMQITRALTLTMESKDEYLIGHSDNVTKYAVILAKHLGLSEKDVYIIAQAGVLHDLGKVGIHDYILNKPGKLTKEEWEEIKQHPIKGAKILQSMPFMYEVAKVVLHHHEHYDGSGYPEGLKGEQIPLLSRILTLADAVDAMMSERPYKEKPMTMEEMITEIIEQKGRHFDPYLVDKFIEIINMHPEIFQTNFKNKQ
ncbi:MAG: HD domain-containing protein, partial [Endomicrobia bacterium]|nr:HD domain-containing protein [Endomicrobiia bacterium]